MPAGQLSNTDSLQWVVINDFRPGIHSKMRKAATAGTAIPAPLGAAQVSGTFKCIALPSGGLTGLPKIGNTFSISLPDTDGNSKFGYFNINGFTSFGPIGPPASNPSGFVDDFFLVVEYIVNTSPFNRTATYYRIDPIVGSDPFPVDTLKSITGITQSQNTETYQASTFAITRMSNTGPNFTNPGNPEVVTNYSPPGFAGNNHVWAFPDPAAPNTTVAVDLASGRAGGLTNVGDILGHQGRVVMLEYLTNSFGARSGDSIPTNEQVSFSDPANSYNTTTTIGTQQEVFMQEYPNGYGAWGSISAGELFLIKHQGGACRVIGDLNAGVTVFRLPGVMPTGGVLNRAAATPSGLAYLSRYSGAYIWHGADTAEKISDQLEDNFFRYTPGPDSLNIPCYQMEWWNDWIVVSNGYLYDTKAGGWWRLDDPSTYTPHWYSRGYFGTDLYACPLRATNAAGAGSKTGFIRQYSTENTCAAYSWQGHPLPVTQDRRVDIRDLVLVAQGTGTVAVTLTAADGTTQTETFTVASNSQPQRLRPATSTAAGTTTGTYAQGYNIVPKLVSTGTGGNPAPVVHSIAFGWRETTRASGA
jgi:hypothetical protein